MFSSAVSKVIMRIIAGIAMYLVIEEALSVLRDLGNSNLVFMRHGWTPWSRVFKIHMVILSG